MFWYENDIRRLENNRQQQTANSETLFYGSSSITQWHTLGKDFAELKPVNLGFGGSTLAACVWFFDRVMAGFHPKRIIIYAGDNDVADGRHPEEIFIFFQQLAVRAGNCFTAVPCYYISLKPSPSRWHLADQFRFTNTLIEQEIDKHLPGWHYINLFDAMLDADGRPRSQYFLPDGLHLNEKGYKLWTTLIKQQLQV